MQRKTVIILVLSISAALFAEAENQKAVSPSQMMDFFLDAEKSFYQSNKSYVYDLSKIGLEKTIKGKTWEKNLIWNVSAPETCVRKFNPNAKQTFFSNLGKELIGQFPKETLAKIYVYLKLIKGINAVGPGIECPDNKVDYSLNAFFLNIESDEIRIYTLSSKGHRLVKVFPVSSLVKK